MKKIFTLALLALATIATNAQTKHTVNVWVDGQKTTIENVDSLTFTEDAKPEPAIRFCLISSTLIRLNSICSAPSIP